MNIEFRLQCVEQEMIVMQKEINEALGETQKFMQALAQTLQLGLRTMHDRLAVLEAGTSVSAPTPESVDPGNSGKEI